MTADGESPVHATARETLDRLRGRLIVSCQAYPGEAMAASGVAGLRSASSALIMADCGSLDDALAAEQAGVDILGTTLAGYTGERPTTPGPDLELVALLAAECELPVIAEGRIRSPADAAAAIAVGAWSVCVGTAITHPSTITSGFVQALDETSAPV